jgi:type IV pilus assembly protein PilM
LVKLFGKQRAVGLDIGVGSVRAMVLEGTPDKARIAGTGAVPIAAGNGATTTAQAIHAALAQAGADGEPVVAAVGGPDVVVRQLTLPPLPPGRVLQALELQHRDFGLLPPSEGLLDAQILRRSKGDCQVLAVSAPKPVVEGRLRLLEQAAVKLRILEVEALAVLNAAIHLGRLDPHELLVALDLGQERAVLCLLSERGPVVVRYLDVGASAIVERLRGAGVDVPDTSAPLGTPEEAADAGPVAEACREVVRRIADEIRMSLAFYRSEYDRESLPRYLLSGWLRVRRLNRWLTDELRLESPFEVIDPFQAVRVTAAQGAGDGAAGPEFVQAFGLALRAL